MKLFQLVDQRNSFLRVTVLSEAGATMTPPFVYEVTLPNISWCKWARRYICVKCCLAITLLSASCQEPKWARRYIHVWSIAFQLLCGALVVKSFKLRKRGRRLVPSGFATGDPWLRWPRRCVVTRRRYLNCTLSSFFADNLSTILTQQRLDLPTPTKEPLCSELWKQTIWQFCASLVSFFFECLCISPTFKKNEYFFNECSQF